MFSLFKGEVRDCLLCCLVNISCNICIMWWNNLCVVFLIYFKFVVFWWVVVCGYYNCGGCIEMVYVESYDRGCCDLVG